MSLDPIFFRLIHNLGLSRTLLQHPIHADNLSRRPNIVRKLLPSVQDFHFILLDTEVLFIVCTAVECRTACTKTYRDSNTVFPEKYECLYGFRR